MAAIDQIRPASTVETFIRFVARTGNAIQDWNASRVTRKALTQLSDRELDDIGLIRGDIDRF